MKAYYFGTCVIDACFPQAGLAGIELLQREGVQVIFPREQSCCGQPAYNSGFPEEARKVARHQLKAFAKDYPIVVPSGSCAGMLKHQYPHLFAGQPDEEAVRHFSSRIYELSEFLVRVLNVQLADRGAPIKVTWHSSCHALREMAIIPYAKALLQQLERVELIALQNEQECCGFGGTFSVKQPVISAVMANDKVSDIIQTGATRVLSTDCGCLLNIAGTLGYRGLNIPVQHLAEFILERTHG